MSSSNKPMKFSYFQKLSNQPMMHGAMVEKMASTSTIVFYESNKILGCSMKIQTFQLIKNTE